MRKKSTILVAAIALVMLIVPGAASAAELTEEEGLPVPAGAQVTAFSSNASLTFSGSWQITCAEEDLDGEVLLNKNEHVKISVTKTTVSTPCLLNNNVPVHVRKRVGYITFDKGGKGYMDSVEVDVESTSVGGVMLCKYVGKGTKGTGKSVDLQVFENGFMVSSAWNLKLKEGPVGCFEELKTEGNFTLFDPGLMEILALDP